MARKIIDIGTVGNDGTGDSIRDSFRKVNDNFRELYSSLGLGEKLKFINLDDTPGTYFGQSNAILSVNDTTDGVKFKQIVGAVGVIVDYDTNPNQIRLSTEFSAIVGDPNPQLGGDLSATSGGNQYRIVDLATPIADNEAVNKGYADTKISRAGVNAVNPATGLVTQAFGTMTGPLILSRDPQDEDDELYDGLIAATKNYVDNAGFSSRVNIYVATSGEDERPGLSKTVQGRSLATAYKTVEAALKRAEEIVLDSPLDIGPYKKVLTYDNGTQDCTLSFITQAPGFGSGFAGNVLMSVDSATITFGGTNYQPGDVITLNGGTGSPATFEVLTTATTPGPVVTFRQLSAGAYSVLPPDSSEVSTTSDSDFGLGLKFSVTYRVNSINITNGGTGYSLVSVRVEPAVGDTTGAGAFGTANISGGVIIGITINDTGSGFTEIPTVVANLPRFLIKTDGLRTDFTGDVTTDTPEAYRGRDLREGLYLRGETSGALAQILSHSGQLDSDGNEIFDVDIVYGSFIVDEKIAYGDSSKTVQVTVNVETGVYEENYPLKIPQNTAICGDEFRRCIIKPRPGTSSSPWAFNKFRRDPVIDGLNVSTQPYGYHYLTDSTEPVHPKINNPGNFKAAAALLDLNRSFIQNEVIAWINYQIRNNVSPYVNTFTYDSVTFKRNVGLIVDSIIFDLKYGRYNRTVSAGLKFYQSAAGLFLIQDQFNETSAAILKIEDLCQSVIDNTEVVPTYQDVFKQILDFAYTAEVDSDGVITDLIDTLIDVINPSGTGVNSPKNNNEMDVFLCNDAVIVRAITCQGHGGFMMSLDPEGQILAKSPYAQECASFSRSINSQIFAGGQFVDGFAGNLEFKIVNKVSNTRLEVSGLDRFPNLPCSFIYLDSVYRINYVRDFTYDPDGSTATFVLDETTPWTFPIFVYDDTICARDVGYIIDGLGYDLVLGTNYNQRKSALTYRGANASVVIDDQSDLTTRAITYAHELAADVLPGSTYISQRELIALNGTNINNVIRKGTPYAPALTFTDPPGVTGGPVNAKNLLIANLTYLQDEIIAWIAAQVAGPIAPFTGSFSYDSITCARDVQYITEALVYDILYGGNSQTRDAGVKYYSSIIPGGPLQIPAGQQAQTVAAIDYLNYLAKQVIQNLNPATAYSSTARTGGTAATATEVTRVNTLLTDISDIITNGVVSADTLVNPDLVTPTYSATNLAARTALVNAKASIQADTITFVDTNANLYELLMPGNRSMLANDFTQVNDLGYGICATNGGLVESVSMFTYYNHISYYSLNGAQIRSVGGSSAHGNYALVAEGSDPLEVPTPTDLYYDLSQRVDSYYPSGSYANVTNGLFIYVSNYSYTPLNDSELEVDHGNGLIYRYPVTSVTTTDLPDGVCRLNLTNDTTGNFDGLYASVADGTKMTMRSNSQIILTGGLVDVAVRPSTGLRLAESPENVYRVLQFEEYQDPNAPYEVEFTAADPGSLRVLATITTIASNVCTTAKVHNLTTGDKFIPTSTGNGLSSGVTYYVIDTPNYNQFKLSTTPNGSSATLSDGTGLTIKGYKTHKLLGGYSVTFVTTGTLPASVNTTEIFWVLSDGLTDTTFRIGDIRNGSPLAFATAGTGVHSYIPEGLTKTTLRENYNYVDLTIYQPGEFTSDYPTGRTCTISIGSPATITIASHGFIAGDVIRFSTTGALPTGLATNKHYHVLTAGLLSGSFRVSETPEGTAIDTSGSQSGVHKVGEVTGRVGDSTFAVVNVSPADQERVAGSKLVYKGEEYTISTFENTTVTNEAFARITLNRPLENSVQAVASGYSIKAGVPIRSISCEGNLTIRISLTRVTSHDLLEIGTGSYADTNYPNEIYGPPVNAINASNETAERDVGRVFYVTTDQFGNFSVGPYFRVDQGTGRVTFSAAIALSNLDGIGFKRGVPIAEFSTDSGMSDNATDTVPTENATRIYIERRLGVSHSGGAVPDSQLIPTITGGFMPLSGILAMKSDMDLGNNKIGNLANPASAKDAVNLRSLTWDNFQDFTGGNMDAADLLVFTGVGDSSVNAQVIGDVTFSLRPGVDSSLNQVDVQINSDTIINADIKSNAAIAQSKLDMQAAVSNTNTAPTSKVQANLGLAAFNSDEFDASFGWINLKTNGIVLTKIEKIPGNHLLGNSTSGEANVAEVSFATVIENGLGIAKDNYGQFSWQTPATAFSTGILRRVGSGTGDNQFQTQEASSASGGYVAGDNYKIVERNSSGNFGGNIVNAYRFFLNSANSTGDVSIASGTALARWDTATGGYTRFYGYSGAGGILVQDGSLATDKKTAYWNNSHEFKDITGASAAPISCSQVQTLLLTTGGNTTPGQITGRWTLTGSSPNESRLQATYSADLAEYYEGDKEYEVGTVLVFGGDKEVTVTNVQGDKRVAGVVSNTAAFAMFEGCPGLKNLVALQGRVPCKVVGKIKKGEMLVTSRILGVAVAGGDDVKVGTVVGKALQDYDNDHIGTIEIAVGRT